MLYSTHRHISCIVYTHFYVISVLLIMIIVISLPDQAPAEPSANIEAIVGGVVGGVLIVVAICAAVVLAVFFFIRLRKRGSIDLLVPYHSVIISLHVLT